MGIGWNVFLNVNELYTQYLMCDGKTIALKLCKKVWILRDCFEFQPSEMFKATAVIQLEDEKK